MELEICVTCPVCGHQLSGIIGGGAASAGTPRTRPALLVVMLAGVVLYLSEMVDIHPLLEALTVLRRP